MTKPVKQMKHTNTDATLTELWAIKDETAARFSTVSEYFEHLAQTKPQRAATRDKRGVAVKSTSTLHKARKTLKTNIAAIR